jgi:hypothetical protein
MATVNDTAHYFDIDRTGLAPPPEALVALVRKVAAERQYNGPERRQSPRHALPNLFVLAIPLDEEQRPCGAPFRAVCRDISVHGISIFHTATVTAPMMALEVTDHYGGKIQVILNVLRRRPVGEYFELAGSFTQKLSF